MSDVCPLCNGDCMFGSVDYDPAHDVSGIFGGYDGDSKKPRIKTYGIKYTPTTDTMAELSKQIDVAITDYEAKGRMFLRKHQYIINRYVRRDFSRDIPRGVFLYHPMGSGKTLTFVCICVTLNRPVIAIMPRALIDNTKETVRRYASVYKMDVDLILSRFSFVSLDAYNAAAQLTKISNGDLNGYTIVVDEAHELFTQICNANNVNGPTIYNMIMNAVDIFIVFASGTPLVKDPYEIVPMANMLSGRQIFPHDYTTFTNLYVGTIWRDVDSDIDGGADCTNESCLDNNYIMPNKWILQNRLVGLISHTVVDKTKFPTSLADQVIYVPMSTAQWHNYTVIRSAEVVEMAINALKKRPAQKRFGDAAIGKASSGIGSSFRQNSRAACNVYRHQDGTIDSNKADKVADDLCRMRLKTIFYSQYKDDGVMVIAHALKKRGCINLMENGIPPDVFVGEPGEGEPDVVGEADDFVDDGLFEQGPTNDGDPVYGGDDERGAPNGDVGSSYDLPQIINFVVLTGDVSRTVREYYRDMFNDKNKNAVGHALCIVLVTRVGTRGLNFIGGRIVGAFESYWTMERMRQLKGRISRDSSHLHLPPEMRYTQFFVYLSDKPADALWSDEMLKWERPDDGYTSDTVLWNKAIKHQYILDEFMDVYKEVSIECSNMKRINGFDLLNSHGDPVNCYQCQNVTRTPLYSSDVYEDIRRGNPCNKVVKKTITSKTIVVDGEKYVYTEDPAVYGTSMYKIAVYYMDTRINSYMRMPEMHESFTKIYNAIKSPSIA